MTVIFDKSVLGILIESGLTISIFLLIARGYSALRKRQGIGAGDIKFLGAAAIWVGLLGMPWVILFASMSGLVFAVVASLRGGAMMPESRLAFGPHLSLGLMLTWLLRDMIHA